jgi:kynurenine formamidase
MTRRGDGSAALYDLTRRVETGMPTYPGDPEASVEPHATFEGSGYRVSRLELGTHTGTHVDAPAHTEADGRTLDAFDVEDFRFDARLVDCRDVDAGGLIRPDALPDDDGADLLVFRTGWEDEWGTARMTDHPALAPETARDCARRGVSVATDALSPDPTGGDGVPAHHAVLGAGGLILENLCNLDAVSDRFALLAFPLRVDADGAPARVVARV